MKLISRKLTLDLSRPQVMGILNVTPDSFSDGGMHNNIIDAIKHTNLMISAGATIIDIGGESTRPGAIEISTEEELSRVIPIIEAIQQRFEIWISVDTSKPDVIRESAQAGVHIINDTRSFSKPGALEAASKTGLPVCLMHMSKKITKTKKISKKNTILDEIDYFFTRQIERCRHAGITKDKLLLDPGFCFGKDLNQNYEILAHLSSFHHFNLPLLVGISRKSMIGKLLNVTISKRLSGSLTCAVIAAMQGVHIIRAHDVKETVEAMRIIEVTLLAKGSKYYE